MADLWGLNQKQARRYVSEPHAEFVNDYEVEDSGLLFACIDNLERIARTSMEKGDTAIPLVQSSCLMKCCSLVLIRKRCEPFLDTGKTGEDKRHEAFVSPESIKLILQSRLVAA